MSIEASAIPKKSAKQGLKFFIFASAVIIIGASLLITLVPKASAEATIVKTESIERVYGLTYVRDAAPGDAGNGLSETGNDRFIAKSDGKSFNCQVPTNEQIDTKATISCNAVETFDAK